MRNTQLRKGLPKKRIKNSVKGRITKIQTTRARVERAYRNLPKWARKIIDEQGKELAIDVMTHTIEWEKRNKQKGQKISSARQKFMSIAEKQKSIQRHSLMGTKRDLYKLFRELEPQVYSRYNSYMYRNGYSASKYFYDNAQITVKGKINIADLDLPRPSKPNRQYLPHLTFELDRSSGDSDAYFTG